MKHPSQRTLLAFIAGTSTEDAVEKIYEHLVECGGCRDRADALRTIVDDPDSALDLLRVSEDPEGVLVQVQGLIDTARGLVTLAGEIVRSGFAVTTEPAFAGVADPNAREASSLLRRASSLLADGDLTSARDTLALAADRRSDAGRSATMSITSDARYIGKVIASGARGRIEVQLNSEVAADGGWIAMIRIDGENEPRVAAFAPIRGATYHVAEFTSVPDGGFRAFLIHE